LLTTLSRRKDPLAQASRQLEILEGSPSRDFPRFDQVLAEHGCEALRARAMEVLQVNVGKVCNQTCTHCHVDAGPDRRENMSLDTVNACLRVLEDASIATLDVTGGAPEMNPHFRYLVDAARKLGRRVIDRSNLTILVAPGYDDLPDFLASRQIEIVASLPCYLEANCDAQRGNGVFRRSIEAIRRLNALGYGEPGGALVLNLVYNPIGPKLPPSQVDLEAAYRRELWVRYQIRFSKLYTITNMPISRFLDDLQRSGQYEAYLQALIAAFNPQSVDGLMCRTTLSVDWQGRLFDCDFNQMLDLGLEPTASRTIHEVDVAQLMSRRIVTGRHCFGCTAGAGSSCQGAIATPAIA
jgi:radical SAM/Cys-rich protein